jgi:Polyketide cyclase / dehydrase and lipid transport
VFEAETSQASQTPPSAIWARWINPSRWSEWDPRVESAQAESTLELGTQVRVKVRKGGTVRQNVVALEPDHLLVTEYALPGARVGHEHRVEARGPGSEVSHRLYVAGPLSGFWAMMLGRKKMRDAATAFTDAARPD